ncbi:hypothetical protein EI012_26150, partial [Escherichia coli]|nr:hypothetical protein [Escherichia coli]
QIAAEQLKVVAAPPKKTPNPQLPTKPLPPAQAVREVRNENSRGGRGGGHGYGRGRGGSGFNRDENSFAAPAGQGAPEGEIGKPSERLEYGGSRGPYRGGRGGRGVFSNGEVGENARPRRVFERHSGTGHGNEFKREGAGKGNWGAETDKIVQVTEDVTS